jgi:hypothetical protein
MVELVAKIFRERSWTRNPRFCAPTTPRVLELEVGRRSVANTGAVSLTLQPKRVWMGGPGYERTSLCENLRSLEVVGIDQS